MTFSEKKTTPPTPRTPLHSTPLHALNLPIQNILLAFHPSRPFHGFFEKKLVGWEKIVIPIITKCNYKVLKMP